METLSSAIAYAWVFLIPTIPLVTWLKGVSFDELFTPATRLMKVIQAIALIVAGCDAVFSLLVQPHNPAFASVPFLITIWANLLFRIAHKTGPKLS